MQEILKKLVNHKLLNLKENQNHINLVKEIKIKLNMLKKLQLKVMMKKKLKKNKNQHMK